MVGELLPDDKDFKTTKKVNWLSATAPNVDLVLVEFHHLITVKKYDESIKFEDIINKNSRFETEVIGDSLLAELNISDVF